MRDDGAPREAMSLPAALVCVVLALGLAGCAGPDASTAGASRPPQGSSVATTAAQAPLVRSVAGIPVSGPTWWRDSDVTKAFGAGLFVEDEGHTGGRYFTDSDRQVTLHVVYSVDSALTYIELSRGLDLPPGLSAKDPALVSDALPANPAVDQGLALGMSGGAIIGKLGSPTRDVVDGEKRTLTYELTQDQDPRVFQEYRATFMLVGDSLQKITLWAGGD
ncbi:MAG: hypothetical protein Q7W30_02970 [Coriobacteriia bacterium]|nr:hypothetical protein [Coriobacteriia bacterium]